MRATDGERLGSMRRLFLLLLLVQACYTTRGVRTSPAGKHELIQCVRPGSEDTVLLVATLQGLVLGALGEMLPAFGNLLGGQQHDSPPLIRIGAAAGIAFGIGTLVFVPRCPQAGAPGVHTASYGPTVRVVMAQSPQINDADARIIRHAGERDVIVFWESGVTPRSILLALRLLDKIRSIEGDSALASGSYPFRTPLLLTPLERSKDTAVTRMLAAELEQARSAYDSLLAARNTSQRHKEPGVGFGVYIDIMPLRHRHVANALPR